MEEIKDLVKMSEVENAIIEELLKTAYKRGFVDGKDLAKKMAIRAIEEER